MCTPRRAVELVPVLGVGAAVAGALAYILLGPDADRRGRFSKTGNVSGLENLGNTCYLNTILQSLAACPSFIQWLNRELRTGFFRGKHEELAFKLSKTMEVVNDHSSSWAGVYSPHEVLTALHGCSWLADRGQQDAHELFHFLLSVLCEDKEPTPSPLSLFDAPRALMTVGRTDKGSAEIRSRLNIKQECDCNSATPPHLELCSSVAAAMVSTKEKESPFHGLLVNNLSCTVCGHKNPLSYSSFHCLTLPITAPSTYGYLSVERLLARFIQSELVHGVDCIECTKLATKTGTRRETPLDIATSTNQNTLSKGRRAVSDSTLANKDKGLQLDDGHDWTTKCQSKGRRAVSDSTSTNKDESLQLDDGHDWTTKCQSTFRKQMTLGKLPQCLCIHIQRVTWLSNGLPSRREEHVRFAEYLDLTPYKQAAISTARAHSLRFLSDNAKPVEAVQYRGQTGFVGGRFLATRAVTVGSHLHQISTRLKQVASTSQTNRMNDRLPTSVMHRTSGKYRLSSAVVHRGSAYSGHFLTFRRTPPIGNDSFGHSWVRVSDENVQTSTAEEVFEQKAYMLYYQRI